MNTIQILDEIDAVIAKNSILLHPFYQAWQRGELKRDMLQDYATQYYHHVAAFPTYLSALHSQTADLDTRQTILENLIDEERGAENHPELGLRFAEEVGCVRTEVLASLPRPETAKFIGEFRALCSGGNVAVGLAALYAYESQIPAVSETKIDGLTKFYSVVSEGGLSYFTVHRDADVEHSAQEREMLARHDPDGACVAAAERVTMGLWGVLSGVWERAQPSCLECPPASRAVPPDAS